MHEPNRFRIKPATESNEEFLKRALRAIVDCYKGRRADVADFAFSVIKAVEKATLTQPAIMPDLFPEPRYVSAWLDTAAAVDPRKKLSLDTSDLPKIRILFDTVIKDFSVASAGENFAPSCFDEYIYSEDDAEITSPKKRHSMHPEMLKALQEFSPQGESQFTTLEKYKRLGFDVTGGGEEEWPLGEDGEEDYLQDGDFQSTD